MEVSRPYGLPNVLSFDLGWGRPTSLCSFRLRPSSYPRRQDGRRRPSTPERSEGRSEPPHPLGPFACAPLATQLRRLPAASLRASLGNGASCRAHAGPTLGRCGQGYSLSDEGLAPVAYPMMPAISADYPLPRKDQSKSRGLRLYETFVA